MLLSPREAAIVIGCTAMHVRLLCREGKIYHKKKPTKSNRFGFEYVISAQEAEKFKIAEKIKPGRPRKAAG